MVLEEQPQELLLVSPLDFVVILHTCKAGPPTLGRGSLGQHRPGENRKQQRKERLLHEANSNRSGSAILKVDVLLMRFFLTLLLIPTVSAYSVLTHEALIDRNWDREIKPLLLARFPGSTDDQLKEARAYTYGGAIIQDMGYYPFGSKFFSNLAHYTRSGDFVMTLIRDAQDLNEYAFALGTLAHYAADNEGHPVAVNKSSASAVSESQEQIRRQRHL